MKTVNILIGEGAQSKMFERVKQEKRVFTNIRYG